MSPSSIAENYQLLVVGIEMSSCNATIARDMEEQGRKAEELGLATTIRHRVDANKYLALLWNWSPGGEFPLMSAAEVTSTRGQPQGCLVRRFPRCDYAIFPMRGVIPNLEEPWSEILDWYPFDPAGFTTTIRRYDELSGTGEILIPLFPNLKPESMV